MIHILCAADRYYGRYAGVMLSSVVRSASEKVHVHLLSDGISKADIIKIQTILIKSGGRLNFYDIRELLDGVTYATMTLGHISRAAFGRIIANEILHENIQYYIYLDCDVIVKADINQLWSLRAEMSSIAAVSDPWVERDIQHKAKVGIGEFDRYYNSGVLLINANAWRKTMSKENISKAISFYGNLRYGDQDLINILFRNQVKCLPRTWNTLVTTPDSDENIDRMLVDASIVHFASGVKPWHMLYSSLGGVGKKYYRVEKSRSPWKFSLPDFHVRWAARKLHRLLEV